MHMNGKLKVVGRDVTAGEVLDIVCKDRPYYRRSGGGMTLSGGEALCQPDFAYALFAGAKERGIDTAIESTGFAPYEDIARVLPYIDHFLMDIKHMDSDKHKLFTTQPNELILENARRIAENANELIIRVPVIPGFNDDEAEMRRIADFVRQLPSVERVTLMPYHTLGKSKYETLGKDCNYDGDTARAHAAVARYEQLFQK
jgi:pyruvate formate lyase activating enzyme